MVVWVISASVYVTIAGLFPDLQAHELRMIMVLRNHEHYRMIETETKASRDVDVINLLLSFNFLLVTYAHLNERHKY